jgi:hypothetical protein
VAGPQALTVRLDRDRFGDDALDADRPMGRHERTAGQGVSMSNLVRSMVVGVASIAAIAGTVALGGNAVAGGSTCPKAFAPVTCSNGKTYTSLCVATANRATDCSPISWHRRQLPPAPTRSLDDPQPD